MAKPAPVERRYQGAVREHVPIPPEVKAKIHARLADLAGANEERYVVVDEAARIATERDRVAVRVWQAAWRLDRMISAPGRVVMSSRVPSPYITIERLARRLDGWRLRACPQCVRPRRWGSLGPCPNCGYAFARRTVTEDDVIAAVASTLDLDPVSIDRRDRLVDLARRPGRTESDPADIHETRP
jgi:hypothetical protein